MVPSAATPSRSRFAPVVGRPLGSDAVVAVVTASTPPWASGPLACSDVPEGVPCSKATGSVPCSKATGLVPCSAAAGTVPCSAAGTVLCSGAAEVVPCVDVPEASLCVDVPEAVPCMGVMQPQSGGGGLTAAPPAQPESAKPSSPSEMPHRLIGAVTGTETEFPDSTEALPSPATLPLLPPAGSLAWVLAPPVHCELAAPPTAPDTPQTFTGALIGTETVLPEPTPTLPLPATLPLLPP